jgi:acid stress-induced BolA-like protein IbaG/YrbA
MMQAETIRSLIEQGLAGAKVIVSGDDGAHFEAIVVSDQFEGKSMVQQHQMVYRALGDKMRAEIHALAMRTYTPAQYAERGGNQAPR